METVEYKNISFTVWDVGGQDKVRLPSIGTRTIIYASRNVENILIFRPKVVIRIEL